MKVKGFMKNPSPGLASLIILDYEQETVKCSSDFFEK